MRTAVRAGLAILALPFQLVSAIAFLLLGLQTLLAIISVFSGTTFATALGNWAFNLIVLTGVAIGAGLIGLFLSSAVPAEQASQPKAESPGGTQAAAEPRSDTGRQDSPDVGPSAGVAYCAFLDLASAKEAAARHADTADVVVTSVLRLGYVEYSVEMGRGVYLCNDGKFRPGGLGFGSEFIGHREPSTVGPNARPTTRLRVPSSPSAPASGESLLERIERMRPHLDKPGDREH